MSYTDLKRVNQDGSRNVWCPLCRSYIGTINAMAAISTATCAVCQAEKDGIELTPEQVRAIRSVRLGENTFSEEVAYPELPIDPMTQASPNEVDAMTGRVGYFVKALVKNMRTILATTKEEILSSKQVAKEKKRSRLFDLSIDEEDKK